MPLPMSLIVHNNHIQITLYSSFGSTFTFLFHSFLSSSTRLSPTNKQTSTHTQMWKLFLRVLLVFVPCYGCFCDVENLFKWYSWYEWCDKDVIPHVFSLKTDNRKWAFAYGNSWKLFRLFFTTFSFLKTFFFLLLLLLLSNYIEVLLVLIERKQNGEIEMSLSWLKVNSSVGGTKKQ